MVLSMTGYGRGEARDRKLAVAVEVKSVNHRHFEAVINLPRGFWELETRIKEIMHAVLHRGHVEFYLHLFNPVPGSRQPVVDIELAGQYVRALRAAGSTLSLPGEPTLPFVAGLPEVVRLEERPVRTEGLARLIEQALTRALAKLQRMRSAEGQRLSLDIRQRLRSVERLISAIKRLSLQKRKDQRNKTLHLSLPRPNEAPETKRMVQEALQANSRSDVTEELVRLGSHVVQFRGFLNSGEPSGRRLDFLLQEMNREINTIGSKSADAAIAHSVVAVKEELEKIREQVQNLE
jgi:uncharacterized protein (TIGR00255 family)